MLVEKSLCDIFAWTTKIVTVPKRFHAVFNHNHNVGLCLFHRCIIPTFNNLFEHLAPHVIKPTHRSPPPHNPSLNSMKKSINSAICRLLGQNRPPHTYMAIIAANTTRARISTAIGAVVDPEGPFCP